MSESSIEKTDHEGRKIAGEEPDDKKILVWCIDPGMIGYDQTWVRSYRRAVEVAQEILAEHWDSESLDDMREHGITITVSLIESTVGDMRDIEEQER